MTLWKLACAFWLKGLAPVVAVKGRVLAASSASIMTSGMGGVWSILHSTMRDPGTESKHHKKKRGSTHNPLSNAMNQLHKHWTTDGEMVDVDEEHEWESEDEEDGEQDLVAKHTKRAAKVAQKLVTKSVTDFSTGVNALHEGVEETKQATAELAATHVAKAKQATASVIRPSGSERARR